MTTEAFSLASLTEALNVRQLRYFVVAAGECNLRRAAEILCISQPPLSRQIKQLEEQLGLTLFVRHTKGLTLTAAGEEVLACVRPLLDLEAETRHALRALAQHSGRPLGVGLSTAFEQGLFAGMEGLLRQRYGNAVRFVRASSPRLLRALKSGRLALALVALPIASQALHCVPLPYAESLVAALPAHWPEARQSSVPLQAFNGRPLFWFRREANPAYFDFTRTVFAHAAFSPLFVEEPAEHEVLLARIAAGEGMGLLPASFAAIRRAGVAFSTLAEAHALQIHLGCVLAPDAALVWPLVENAVENDVENAGENVVENLLASLAACLPKSSGF